MAQKKNFVKEKKSHVFTFGTIHFVHIYKIRFLVLVLRSPHATTTKHTFFSTISRIKYVNIDLVTHLVGNIKRFIFSINIQ